MNIIFSILIFITFTFANEIKYHEDGSIKSEIIYKDSNTTKIEKIYRRNGHVLLIQIFKYDKQDGMEKWYHDNGKIWIESEYKDSKQHGFSKEYTDKGYLLKESFYKNGNKTSTILRKYYNNTNIIEAVVLYKFNKLNGLSRWYYQNGNERSVIPFVNGKVNGIMKSYYRTKELKSNLVFKNDIINGVESYSKNGVLIRKSKIKNKRYDGVLYEFYDNGNKKNIFHFENGEIKKGLSYKVDGSKYQLSLKEMNKLSKEYETLHQSQ